MSGWRSRAESPDVASLIRATRWLSIPVPSKHNCKRIGDARMQCRVIGLALTLLAALVLAATPVAAQTWPQRPVKFIVTLGPGSGVDIGTRLISDRLTRRWGQPIIVENRPG